MKMYFRYIFGKIAAMSIMMLVLLVSIVWSIEIVNIGRGGVLLAGIGFIKFVYLCSFIIPYDATLVWPMAMFFGVLMAIHQMQNRGEFLAFRVLGLSHFKLFFPILVFSVISTGVCYFLTLEIGPTLYKELRIRKSAAEEKAVLSMLKKQKFNNFNGSTIYFENIAESGQMNNVIIWQNTESNDEISVINADSLKFIKQSSGITVVVLENAINYKISKNKTQRSSISTSKHTYVTLSSIIKPKKSDFIYKRFYITGFKELYDGWILRKDRDFEEEFHNRVLRPFYSIVMAVFIYAIMAARNGTRSNEIIYFVKYIISFIALTIFGAESTKFFGNGHLWYICYVISFVFLLYGFYKIYRLNYKNS